MVLLYISVNMKFQYEPYITLLARRVVQETAEERTEIQPDPIRFICWCLNPLVHIVWEGLNFLVPSETSSLQESGDSEFGATKQII